MKAIRYKYHPELFVLNGSKRPIRYKFQNGVKPNWYNGNMVYVTCKVVSDELPNDNRKVSILGRERVWYPIFPSHQNFGNGYQDTRKTSYEIFFGPFLFRYVSSHFLL